MFDWLTPLKLPLVQRAFFTLLFAGATFSLLGVFVVTLNLTVIRFALLHVGLLGAALFTIVHWDPLLGGLVAIIASATLLGPLGDRLKLTPGAVSAFFMTGSLAVAFILFYKAGVPAMEVFSLFAGNVFTVRPLEMWITLGLGLAVVAVIIIYYRELQAILYHREFADSLGISSHRIYYGLLGVIGIAIAVAIRLVGALLVDALILLPAMAALPLARNLAHALVLSAVFGLVTSLSGIGLSLGYDWPIGASVGVAGVLVLCIGHMLIRPIVLKRRKTTPVVPHP